VVLPFGVDSLPKLLKLRHLLSLPSNLLEQALVWLEFEVVLDLCKTCLALVFLYVIGLSLKVLGHCISILVEGCSSDFERERFLLMERSLGLPFEGFGWQVEAALVPFESRDPQEVGLGMMPSVLLELDLRLILRCLGEARSEAPPLPCLAVNAEFGLGTCDAVVLFVILLSQVSQDVLMALLGNLFASLARACIRQVSEPCIFPQ